MFLESGLVYPHSSSRGRFERNEIRGYCVSHKIAEVERKAFTTKKRSAIRLTAFKKKRKQILNKGARFISKTFKHVEIYSNDLPFSAVHNNKGQPHIM